MRKGEYSINTEYFTVFVQKKGRRIVIELNEGVSASRHNMMLLRYVKQIYKKGVDRINADHITLPFLDRSISVWRGKRKVDVVYFKNGIKYDCEIKTEREVGSDRTYKQLAELAKNCENLTLVVPQSAVENAKKNLHIFKLDSAIKIEAFE